MATYSNLGITLITTGDESGTWGTTTNSNFENILDEAIAGAVTYNISSDADFTLTVVDATSSDARHAVIKFTSTTLSATRTCTFAPDTLQKTWVVINATTGGQSLTFKQGSAGATVTVPNGESAIIYSDGGGASAGAITRVLDSFTNTKITTGTLNATTLDLTNLEVTNIKAKDGTAALTISDSTGKVTVSSELAVDNLNLSGNAITSTDSNGNIDLTPNGTGEVNISKVDIDSGAIDGTTIGANSAAAGTFTTATATTGNITAVNATTVDATNVEVTNIKAKDGTAAATIADSTGVISLSANPTLSGGTANGVLYLNGSKEATSGSAFVFDGTNVGIGTSSPQGKLNVVKGTASGTTASTSANNIVIDGTSGTETGMTLFSTVGSGIRFGDASGASQGVIEYAHATDYMRFITNAAERMRITSAGLVGIATTAPTHNLTVGSTAASDFVISLRGGVGGFFGWDDSANLTILQSPNTRALSFQVNSDTFSSGTEAMRITSAGLVGIGTSSPSYRLSVEQSASAVIGANIRNVNTGASAYAGIYFGGTASATDVFIGAVGDSNTAFGGGRSAVFGTNTTTPIAFTTNGTEKMRLDSSGNLGIGTSSPSAKLHVNGDYQGAGNIITSSGIIRSPDGSAATPSIQPGVDADTGFFRPTTNTIGFSTAGTERARITAGGDLLVGTTSSILTGVTTSVSSNGAVGYAANNVNTGTLAYTYLQLGNANSSNRAGIGLLGSGYTASGLIRQDGLYIQCGGAGGLTLTTEAAQPIYFGTNNTERARITAAGDVGIGTTSPQAKLDVSAPLSSNGPTIRLSSTGTTASSGQQIGAVDFYNSDADIPGVAAYVRALAGPTFGVGGELVFGTQSTWATGVLSERARITAGGYFKASNNGSYDNSTGSYHEFSSDQDNHAVYVRATNASLSTTGVLQLGISRNTTNNSFYVISYYNSGAAAYRFRVADSGAIATAGGIALGTNTAATSGIGVQFPATQSASSNANTLDDYEEGTFTPTVSGSTSAGTGTYNSQVGRYTKIGNVVTASVQLEWTAHTGTGNLLLTNLPFTSVNVSGAYSSVAIGYVNNIALSANHYMTAIVDTNTTTVLVYQYPTGGGAGIAVPIDTAGQVNFTVVYEAAN